MLSRKKRQIVRNVPFWRLSKSLSRAAEKIFSFFSRSFLFCSFCSSVVGSFLTKCISAAAITQQMSENKYENLYILSNFEIRPRGRLRNASLEALSRDSSRWLIVSNLQYAEQKPLNLSLRDSTDVLFDSPPSPLFSIYNCRVYIPKLSSSRSISTRAQNSLIIEARPARTASTTSVFQFNEVRRKSAGRAERRHRLSKKSSLTGCCIARSAAFTILTRWKLQNLTVTHKGANATRVRIRRKVVVLLSCIICLILFFQIVKIWVGHRSK